MKAIIATIAVHLWGTESARRRFLIGSFGFVGLGGGLAFGSWNRACAGTQCPSISALEVHVPDQTSKLFAADGRLIAELGIERRTVLTLDEMAPAVPQAFVAIEDKRFYDHGGIDWRRFFGAVVANVRTFSWEQGFSTITMQLARNVFPDLLPREKLLTRKVREAKVAIEIEHTYAKDKILELYLNQIHMGRPSLYGVDAAAHAYFGKSARDVNVAEAALLAALAQRPGRYDPRIYPERAIARRNIIIGLMRGQGVLTADEAAYWQAYPLTTDRAQEQRTVAPYFVEHVRQQLTRRFGDDLYRRGLNVFTTLDLDVQETAERILEAELERIEGDSSWGAEFWGPVSYQEYLEISALDPDDIRSATTPYLQAAFLAMDAETGYVRALIGGRDFEDSKFNRATQAERQAGSTFKPFVYSAALRFGNKPVTYIVNDSALSVEQRDSSLWQPQDFDNNPRGLMTMRQSLYGSRNLSTIRLGMEIGERTVIGEARKYGLTSRLSPFPSIHIGSADVTLIDMVAAYTTFANLGYRTTPVFVQRVEDRDGNILLEAEVRRYEVLDPQRAWLMVDMLRDVTRKGPDEVVDFGGTAAGGMRYGGFNHPTGGKTGTTDDGTDVWYLGFTRDMVAGVWMGFDEKARIAELTGGGRLAAPTWARIMSEVYSRRTAPGDWPSPQQLGLVTVDVDQTTGFLHTPYCPIEYLKWEWFVPGTEPVHACPVHDIFAPIRPLSRP